MPQPFDPTQSLERLEGQRWPDSPRDATSLVKAVHALRRRPVGDLRPDELARLITQDVGLSWLLPIAVRILRDTAPGQATGGWYDDDLLYAVVTRNPRVWEQSPDLAHELRRAVETLVDLSRYVRDEAETFLASLPEAPAAGGFWAAPESRAVRDALPPPVLAAIARCDAERLEVERSRVAPHVRRRMTAPVYSVADRFASWERLARRMEPGWAGEDYYSISAYGNDLDSRDALEQVMRALPAETGEGLLPQLLGRLDARFRASTLSDPERSLRLWARPPTESPEEELGEWWRRKPVHAPWTG